MSGILNTSRVIILLKSQWDIGFASKRAARSHGFALKVFGAIFYSTVELACVLCLFFIRAEASEVDPATRDGQAKQMAQEEEKAILIS